MNYSIITSAPTNLADFAKVPGTDCREQFIKFLRGLLQQKTTYIFTDPVPIEWVTTTAKVEDISSYSVMMQQVPVNFGELGTAHGIFYLKRTQPAQTSN